LSDLVKSIMNRHVQIIRPESSLRDVLKKMVKANIGSVVVAEANRPLGIITERDILTNLAKGTRTLRTPVRRTMSSPLISIPPDTSVQEAVKTMLKHGIRRLPIVRRGMLVGIVTQRDLMKWVLRVSYEPNPPAEIREILALPLSKL
jgi:CBS domain-containing protein